MLWGSEELRESGQESAKEPGACTNLDNGLISIQSTLNSGVRGQRGGQSLYHNGSFPKFSQDKEREEDG